MIHMYREVDALHGRRLVLGVAAMALLLQVVDIAVTAGFALGFAWTWNHLLFHAPAFVLSPVAAYFTYRRYAWRVCREIRLDDNGTCELETSSGVIRLHVNEITEVKYRRDPEGGSGSYTIRYVGGRLEVDESMANFRDFLGRLRALNPAVDVTSVPTNAPSRGTGSDRSERNARSALFPILVIALLAWLALKTLTGG